MKRLNFLILLFFADFVLCNQYVIEQKSEEISVNINDEYIKSFTSYVQFVPYETLKLPVCFSYIIPFSSISHIMKKFINIYL